MDYYKNDVTHCIIKFNEKNKQGKDTIDLVPISWSYNKNGQMYSKYPNQNEYHKIDELCKQSTACDPSWNDFKVTIVKKACK